MPWKVSSVTEERLRFVVRASQPDCHFSDLCKEFGISRQTGYTWQRRYAEGGASQVSDRSRRPKRSPQRTSAEVESAVVALRQQRPDWGAAKLHVLLQQQHPSWKPVTVRTIHRILERQGLVLDEDRRVQAPLRFERAHPNELWQMDFKGPQGFNRPGSAVGPLVILDDHSRYLLALKHLGSTAGGGVLETLQEVWEQVGQPEAMLVDHGTPWWSNANPWGLSAVSVWIMRHGVRLYYSGVRHPQTQGKTERANGCLQRALQRRQGDPENQQWLNEYRYEYNHVRPHEALGMATPASRWRPSRRYFQAQPPPWPYPASQTVLEVGHRGEVHWQGRRWPIGEALRGQQIGIELLEDRALVYFCSTPLRELEVRTGRTYTLPVQVSGAASE